VAISYPTNESQGEDKIAELDLKGNVIAKYEAGTDPENFVVNDHAPTKTPAQPRSQTSKRIA